MSVCDLNSENPTFVLSAVDRKLVLATQQGLPITEKPFDVLSAQLGIGVDEVISRLQRMLDAGLFGASQQCPTTIK